MIKQYTKEQINKKFKGLYISFISRFDYQKGYRVYENIKSYNSIRENTTLGEDVGNSKEFTR